MRYPRISVEGEAVTDDRAFAPEITVTEQMSADSPAFVRIELTNTAQRPMEMTHGYITPFHWMKGHLRDGSKALYLVPGKGETRFDNTVVEHPEGTSLIPDAPTDGCWRVTEELWCLGGKLWEAVPGATHQRDYAVLDEPESSTCLQPGTYRFEVTWEETPLQEYPDGDTELRFHSGDTNPYSWEFTVTLQEN